MLNIEKGVLANALMSVDIAFNLVKEGDIFLNNQHSLIFNEIEKCIKQGIPPTATTVSTTNTNM